MCYPAQQRKFRDCGVEGRASTRQLLDMTRMSRPTVSTVGRLNDKSLRLLVVDDLVIRLGDVICGFRATRLTARSGTGGRPGIAARSTTAARFATGRSSALVLSI